MQNKTLQQALYCLAHPLSIGAILLLLLNDHVFKALWPSWWTGKLSDFAGLLFAPFLLAVPLALLIPRHVPQHEKKVGQFALALTGVAFALIKAVPIFNIATLRLLESIGFPIVIRLDPTDLIALPVLFLAWKLWQQPFVDAGSLKRRGWTMLLLGALASIATSPPRMDIGIGCLFEYNGNLTAMKGLVYGLPDGSFISDDGGVSWQSTALKVDYQNCIPSRETQELIDPTNSSVRYHLGKNTVLRSDDAGKTWQSEVNWLVSTSEAYLLYRQWQVYNLHPTAPYSSYYRSGPQAAVMDKRSGNLVIALGHDGILVRRPNGEWLRVSVGPYAIPNPEAWEIPLSVLSSEFWSALILIPLSAITITNYLRGSDAITALMVFCWIFWLVTVIAFQPGHYPPDLSLLPAYLLGAPFDALCAVISVLILGESLLLISDQSYRAIVGMFTIATITACLFFLPYLLWSHDIIPHYDTAIGIALGFSAFGQCAGYYYLRHVAQVKSKKKKKKKRTDDPVEETGTL